MAVLEQSLKNITIGSEQVQWSYLSPPNLHGITQILLQIAALFAVQKYFLGSGFQFCVRFWPRQIRRVKPKKLLNVKLLVRITILICKWCREIPFESSHDSMILTNLSQLSSESLSLSVKFTRKVYWSVWKHTVEKLVIIIIHSSELW